MSMKRLSPFAKNNIITYGLVIVGFITVQLLISSGNMSYSFRGQLVPICAYIVMALSLNLTVGVMGELSLGHAGFMSVGAFAGAIACIALQAQIPNPSLNLAVGMIIGAIFAGLTGFLIGIPVLRLKGDYLAIVTLAFGEIIKNVITCLYVGRDASGLRFGFLTSIADLNLGEGARTIVDGPMGLRGIPRISTFTMGFALILVTLFIIQNFVNSRSGRAVMALRDNRLAAESVGIPAAKYKLMAFTMSASLAGAAGALFVMNYSAMAAAKFDFNTSILVLVFVVLGGLGNMWGSIIAAAALTILPELLRQFNDYRMLVYAIALILIMLATNNSTIRGFITKVFSVFSKIRGGKKIEQA